MNTRISYACQLAILAGLVAVPSAQADFGPGLFTDFSSGTTEGWSGGAGPTIFSDAGPSGPGDSYLRIGNGGRLASYNTSASGVVDPSLVAVEVDLQRPTGESDLDMRLVLFGPGTNNRWTSSVASVVPGNGDWATYSFSLLETDLTRVQGSASYNDLVGSLNRIMLRYDPDTPSSQGQGVAGTLGIDNVFALTPGDYNRDGSVDTDDYTAWDAAFGSSVAVGSGADGNADGVIDAADYTVWRDALPAADATAVPEPGTLALLLTATALLGRGARRRSVTDHRS